MVKTLLRWLRPDPFAAEMAAFRAADAASPPSAGVVLFVGSSSFRLWESLAQDMAPIPALKRAFGGSTIADVNRRFEAVAAPYAPRAIMFYAGDNDLDFGSSAASVIRAFKRFLRLKEERFGPAPVYFLAIKPSPGRPQIAQARDAVNAAIRDLAAARDDLTFIDIEGPMLAHEPLGELFVEDGVHLSPEGYKVWAASIRPALAPHFSA